MKQLIITLSFLFLAACSAPTNPNLSPQPPQTSETPPSTELETLLTLVNEARAAGQTCGSQTYPSAPALSWNATLGVTAQKHSEDMAAAGTMSHETPDGAIHYKRGSSPFDRMKQEGYDFQTAAENVAWGYSSPESVNRAWLDSPGHCKNMMGASFTEMGLGLEGTYWTQVFARPR